MFLLACAIGSILALMLAAAAQAPPQGIPIGPGFVGFPLGPGTSMTAGGGPPPSCSNKLDFSQACNSQYLIPVGLLR